ncbi:hypothetical protein ABIB66_008047 [Bradyrhizobium sp. F1.13.3]
MIQLRRHNSRDYAALPDIDLTSAGRLAGDDHACLDEVGRCLVKEHANERFGATLLHSHFPIRDDEVLVEKAHGDSQLITLRPISEVCPDLVPTSVCFEGPGDAFGLIGLEFTSSDSLAGVWPLASRRRSGAPGRSWFAPYVVFERATKSPGSAVARKCASVAGVHSDDDAEVRRIDKQALHQRAASDRAQHGIMWIGASC